MTRVVSPLVTRERDGRVARVTVGSRVRRNAFVDSILRSSDASIRAGKRALTQLAAPARTAARALAGPPTHEPDFNRGVTAFLRRRRRGWIRLPQSALDDDGPADIGRLQVTPGA